MKIMDVLVLTSILAQDFNIQLCDTYDLVKKGMQSILFKHKLIANAMIFIILLSFAVHASVMSVSILSKKAFSGVVYASPGIPVSGAMVMAIGSEGYGYATTNSLGQYNINEGLKTGNYTVQAIAQGYLIGERENVTVQVGLQTSGIDVHLKRSGGISGKVTDAVSALPLQNIMITAFNPSNSTYSWTAITDANGEYHIITNLATGTYNVSTMLPEGYIMKNMGEIAVTEGAEVTGVNLALERSGILSGKITANTPSGPPLQNTYVFATSDDGNYMGFTHTNATGHYRIISGLGTENYTVTAMYGIHINYTENVSIVAGAETSGIDMCIIVSPPTPSGIITGKVTDIDDNPIEGAEVTAQGPGGFGQDNTDENGEYIISEGLGTGSYAVIASAVGYSPENVTGVSVTVGEITPHINLQLSRIPAAQSGSISGAVQGDENPIPESQYPIALLLVVTLVAVALTKLFNVKARRSRLP
jgi:hypothetical protein